MTLRSHEVKAQGYRYDHEGAVAARSAAVAKLASWVNMGVLK